MPCLASCTAQQTAPELVQRSASYKTSDLPLRAGQLQPPALHSSQLLQDLLQPVPDADGNLEPAADSFAASELQLVKPLGRGSFGQVFHAILDGQHLAVKYSVVSSP